MRGVRRSTHPRLRPAAARPHCLATWPTHQATLLTRRPRCSAFSNTPSPTSELSAAPAEELLLQPVLPSLFLCLTLAEPALGPTLKNVGFLGGRRSQCGSHLKYGWIGSPVAIAPLLNVALGREDLCGVALYSRQVGVGGRGGGERKIWTAATTRTRGPKHLEPNWLRASKQTYHYFWYFA